MTNKTNNGLQLYRVLGAISPQEDGPNRHPVHRNIGIVAYNAPEAVRIAEEKFPNLRIDAVNHHGRVDYIVGGYQKGEAKIDEPASS